MVAPVCGGVKPTEVRMEELFARKGSQSEPAPSIGDCDLLKETIIRLKPLD